MSVITTSVPSVLVGAPAAPPPTDGLWRMSVAQYHKMAEAGIFEDDERVAWERGTTEAAQWREALSLAGRWLPSTMRTRQPGSHGATPFRKGAMTGASLSALPLTRARTTLALLPESDHRA